MLFLQSINRMSVILSTKNHFFHFDTRICRSSHPGTQKEFRTFRKISVFLLETFFTSSIIILTLPGDLLSPSSDRLLYNIGLGINLEWGVILPLIFKMSRHWCNAFSSSPALFLSSLHT